MENVTKSIDVSQHRCTPTANRVWPENQITKTRFGTSLSTVTMLASSGRPAVGKDEISGFLSLGTSYVERESKGRVTWAFKTRGALEYLRIGLEQMSIATQYFLGRLRRLRYTDTWEPSLLNPCLKASLLPFLLSSASTGHAASIKFDSRSFPPSSSLHSYTLDP